MAFQAGKHCAREDCRALDFLPIQCVACCQYFCKDHHVQGDGHDCPANLSADARAFNPVLETLGKTPCQAPKCSVHELIPLRCSGCEGRFCTSHRHPDQHACPSLVDVRETHVEARALLAKHFPMKQAEVHASAPPVQRTKPKKTSPLLELMKLKQVATWDPRIEATRQYDPSREKLID